MAESTNRIVQITACSNKGKDRDFVNVYGLDEKGRVWRWDPTQGKWLPYRIEKRASREAGWD